MMSRKHVVYSLIGALALLLAACTTPAGQPPANDATPTPVAETPQDSRDLPPEAVLDAQSWLAEQRGVSAEQVTIVDTEQQEWTDSCLGLGGPAESCAAVITPGWRVILEIDGQQYEVRTDESGETIRMATPDAETPGESRDLPPEAVLDAQSWLAEQRGVPVEQVNIVEMEQQEWTDSCLGLGGPAESCAAVITPGWRVILEIDGQQYEVRTDESGETIRMATSNSERGITNELSSTQWTLVSFGPEGDTTPVIEGSTVTLAFTAGRAEGNGGCNSYSGPYQVEGDTISVSEITSTMMACVDDSVTQQEQRYFQALQSAGTFEVQDNRLLITYDDGQSVLTFESASS